MVASISTLRYIRCRTVTHRQRALPLADSLPKLLAAWLEGVRPEHRDLMIQLHRIVMSAEPDFTLSLKWRNPAYSFGGQAVLYLADQADYVHLGFYNGSLFEDPARLIEGTGKRMRHIKIASMSDDLELKLREMITASLTAATRVSG